MPGQVRGFNSPTGDPGAQGLNVVPEFRDGDWVTKIEFGEYGEKGFGEHAPHHCLLCVVPDAQ